MKDNASQKSNNYIYYNNINQPKYTPNISQILNNTLQNQNLIQDKVYKTDLNTPYQPCQIYPQNNNIVNNNSNHFLVNKNNYSLEMVECFEDLNEAIEAIIVKSVEYKCFQNIPIYEISIKSSKSGIARNIFIGKKKYLCCCNSIIVNIKYVPRDSDYSILFEEKNFDKKMFELKAKNNIYNSMIIPNVQINNAENNSFFGNITIRDLCTCCCSDPDFEIRNNFNFIKYRVTTDGCQCSYCCMSACCCTNYSTSFKVLDSTRTQIVGEIYKNEFSQTINENLTYTITFPIDSSVEEKILIISAAIAIDLFMYGATGIKSKVK